MMQSRSGPLARCYVMELRDLRRNLQEAEVPRDKASFAVGKPLTAMNALTSADISVARPKASKKCLACSRSVTASMKWSIEWTAQGRLVLFMVSTLVDDRTALPCRQRLSLGDLLIPDGVAQGTDAFDGHLAAIAIAHHQSWRARPTDTGRRTCDNHVPRLQRD